MLVRMARWGVVLVLVGFAAGCGRSELSDELGLGSDDGGVGFDDGDDGTAPDDVTVPPPTMDVYVPPPTRDVYVPPPYKDVYVPPPPSRDGSTCGPSNCSGCCQSNGTCLPLASMALGPGLCGAKGEACSYCNQFCFMGGCGSTSTNCGPTNCKGCCAGNGACSDGTHVVACGSGGGQCETCSSGAACNPAPGGAGGYCMYVPVPCDSSSCSTGCCINGICAQGSQDIACGTGGSQCVDCTVSNLTCLFQQCGGGFNH